MPICGSMFIDMVPKFMRITINLKQVMFLYTLKKLVEIWYCYISRYLHLEMDFVNYFLTWIFWLHLFALFVAYILAPKIKQIIKGHLNDVTFQDAVGSKIYLKFKKFPQKLQLLNYNNKNLTQIGAKCNHMLWHNQPSN